MKDFERFGLSVQDSQNQLEKLEKYAKQLEEEGNKHQSFKAKVATEVIEKLKQAVEQIEKGSAVSGKLVTRVSDWYKPITSIQD